MTIQELLQKKGELAEQAKAVLNDPGNAGRIDLRAEDQTKFDAIHVDIEKITKLVENMQRQDALEASLNGTERRTEPNPIENRQTEQRRQSRTLNQHESAEAFRAWLLPPQERNERHVAIAQRAGVNLDGNHFKFSLAPVAMRGARIGDGYVPDVVAWKAANDEQRAALGTTSGAVGQYTIPDAMMQSIELALLAFGGMRQVATVLRTDTGASLPFPMSDDTSNSGVILTENNQVSETDPTFTQTVLDSFMYSSKSVLVSLQLLQDSSINVPDIVGSMLGTRIARAQNAHYTTGTGSGQPNGVITAATTSSVTFAAVAAVTYDEMVNVEHSVDPAYRPKASWMFHDGGLKMLKKVKALQYSGDLTGMPIWQPGLAVGQPNTILGYPYTVNQSMTTPATSVKSILFGDLSKYTIRDVREITLVRLNERYADYHQVGFLAFARSDGDLLDAGTHPVKYGTQA